MMIQTRRTNGFTLVELMIVIAIIGILAAVAIPAYQQYTTSAKAAEAFTLSPPIQKAVGEYYDRWGEMPADNDQAGLPVPNSLRGQYVSAIEVAGGMIGIQFSANIGIESLNNKIIYLRPAINSHFPTAPIIWICNDANVPNDFQAYGETDPEKYPENISLSNCR